MRILFSAYSEKTHFFSMVPLAWALRAAGHEVRVASHPELAPTITEAGLTAVPVGRDHGMWRVLSTVHGTKHWSQVPPFDVADQPADAVSFEYLKDGYDGVVPWWFRLTNDSLSADLIEFARQWRPDLVVWEPTTFAGAVAAEAVGALHARLTWGVDLHGRVREMFVHARDQQRRGPEDDPLRRWLARLAGSAGVPYSERLTVGHFTIDQLPPSFRLPTSLRYVDMRYVPYNGPSVVEEWLRRPPSRPRVGVCLGLTARERGGDEPLPLARIVEALAAADVEVVVAPAPTGVRLPANVRTAEFVPLQALAPTCSALVHHGGFGTACTTSVHGVPQLAIADQLDAPLISRGIERYGAGLHLDPRDADPASVSGALARLLGEPGFRRGAERLREDMTALPSPASVAEQLVESVSEHRARQSTPAR
ncbi:activator-dependent family glycosyltransferase [Nocardiopsis dassonvillei subsp. albirubida]|uniref:Activator-dependent family glycosyltransferase n=1 Tax=Nocardiopsis alborubida TaxID=146802 RepID=A0A7X6MIU9_9ACTN|nr:activator-dependent family glycosyltransferase [Nocardiopsis alborubida]